MSGGKDSGKPQTATQTPWAPAQDYLLNGMAGANMLWQSGLGFATPFNQNQQTGQQMGLDYANNFGQQYAPYQQASMGALQQPGVNMNPFGINGAVQQGLGTNPDSLGAGGAIQQGMNAQPNPLGLNGALQQQGMMGPSAGNNPFGINSAIQQGLNAPNVNSNPYLEQYAQAATRPLEQQLKMSTMPGIRMNATGAGQSGGSRQGIAEGVAQGLTNQAIGDTRANIFSNAYGQGLGAQANALGAANQAYSTDINRQQGAFGLANQNYGLGSQERQASIGNALQNYGLGANYQLGSLGAATNAYGQGLDQQYRAMSMYPQMLQAGLTPSSIYGAVGDAQQANQNAAQIDPWTRASAYQGLINGTNIGQYGTTSQSGGSGSRGMNALGGGVLGQGLGSMLGLGLGPLSGGGVGALLGALGGLFG